MKITQNVANQCYFVQNHILFNNNREMEYIVVHGFLSVSRFLAHLGMHSIKSQGRFDFMAITVGHLLNGIDNVIISGRSY